MISDRLSPDQRPRPNRRLDPSPLPPEPSTADASSPARTLGRIRPLRLAALALVLAPLVLAVDTIRRAPGVAFLERENPERTHWMEVREKQARKAGARWKVNQKWVPLSRVSRPARLAVIAAEDNDFYNHEGFDLEEIQAAMERNWKRKRWVRGASTISQQLAKNLWLWPGKSLFRKAEEALLTYRLEKSVSKNRILELYLNVAEWGPGIFGIEAASNRYLGKSSASLSADEGALLAAMLPNPFRLSPEKNRGGVERRQRMILRRMRRLGYLSPPPTTAPPPPPPRPAAVTEIIEVPPAVALPETSPPSSAQPPPKNQAEASGIEPEPEEEELPAEESEIGAQDLTPEDAPSPPVASPDSPPQGGE
ncbi:MAG: monofunctional biosynthetic peptidoglycan transglycosylase [Nitrospirae bacterium]|nr:monofunctional biosynthetic peptidoglycan transglycosylase [Nitrospirota bacterium]